MLARVFSLVLVAALFVALVDCGGGSTTSSGGTTGSSPDGSVLVSGTPIPLADLCPVFTGDLCTYLMQCNHAGYRDLDHCRAELDCFGLSDLTASSMEGGVIYDPSQVGACHARFLGDPCHFGFFLFTPDIFEVLSYCPGTIAAQRKDGEGCVSSGECLPGLYCLKIDSTCPGTCTPFAKDGDACAAEVRCESDLHCNNDHVCRPRAKDGDACAAVSDCGPQVICLNSPDCQDANLWCDLAAGFCKPGGGAGAPCGPMKSETATSEAQCANGLWCDHIFIDMPGTCRAPGGEGSPCGQLGGCTPGLHCAGYVPFGIGATLGKCAPPVAAAGMCTSSSDCEPGLRCIAGACGAPVAFGETCSADADCQPGLVCPTQRCIHARYPGDPCGDADSTCVLSVCKGGTCRDHAKVGEACVVNEDCATRTCTDGKCVDTSVCARR